MNKVNRIIIVSFVTLAIGLASGVLSAADVTAPGDAIKGVPDDGDWPGGEYPALAIDNNSGTKYLHFKGELGITGFQVTPSVTSIVTGLTLTTANDCAGRDPIAFELSGSNVSIDGPYTLIARGDVVDFALEAEWPRFTMNETEISFDNSAAYDHYQIVFTAIRGPLGGCVDHMQIAEVELLGACMIAYSPTPANGAEGLALDTVISWLPGICAATHDVYFGTSSIPALAANQEETTYDPGTLEYGTT